MDLNMILVIILACVVVSWSASSSMATFLGSLYGPLVLWYHTGRREIEG